MKQLLKRWCHGVGGAAQWEANMHFVATALVKFQHIAGKGNQEASAIVGKVLFASPVEILKGLWTKMIGGLLLLPTASKWQGPGADTLAASQNQDLTDKDVICPPPTNTPTQYAFTETEQWYLGARSWNPFATHLRKWKEEQKWTYS